MRANDPMDPKGLIRESYLIEGITAPECRSIFLDWALSIPQGADAAALVRELLARHKDAPEGHPMTETLKGALVTIGTPKRRGGRAGRLSGGSS